MSKEKITPLSADPGLCHAEREVARILALIPPLEKEFAASLAEREAAQVDPAAMAAAVLAGKPLPSKPAPKAAGRPRADIEGELEAVRSALVAARGRVVDARTAAIRKEISRPEHAAAFRALGSKIGDALLAVHEASLAAKQYHDVIRAAGYRPSFTDADDVHSRCELDVAAEVLGDAEFRLNSISHLRLLCDKLVRLRLLDAAHPAAKIVSKQLVFDKHGVLQS